MKKLLVAFGLIGLATASFGQGEINFANSATSRLTTNSVVGGPSTGSTFSNVMAPYGYYVAMFIANQSITQVGASEAARSGYFQDYAFDDPNWTMLPTLATNVGIGRFRTADGPQGGSLTPGYPSQSSASFVAIAWSANIGSTVDELKNWYHGFGVGASGPGWIGESQVGAKMLIGGDRATPTIIFNGINPGFIPGWMLGLIIPEPAFLTVTGFGVAAILVSSRRSKRRRRHRRGAGSAHR